MKIIQQITCALLEIFFQVLFSADMYQRFGQILYYTTMHIVKERQFRLPPTSVWTCIFSDVPPAPTLVTVNTLKVQITKGERPFTVWKVSFLGVSSDPPYLPFLQTIRQNSSGPVGTSGSYHFMLTVVFVTEVFCRLIGGFGTEIYIYKYCWETLLLRHNGKN